MNMKAGITGLYTDPDLALAAAVELREAGYSSFDIHTPYPLHGLDEAMGIKRTILPWIALGAGIVGLAVAFHLQWWTGAVDYPLVVGGKPLFAVPPSIPIAFEMTVLFTAIATTIALFALSGLPRWWSKWQGDPNFSRATDDAFVVTIDAGDPVYNDNETTALLERLGAEQIRIVSYHEE